MSTNTQPRTSSPRSLTALQDRVLLMATHPTDADVAAIDQRRGGLVVQGSHAAGIVASLRRAMPQMTLLIEQSSASTYQATENAPFQLPADDGIFPLSLSELLHGQRQAGASLVITPSGQVAAGDSGALKSIVTQANSLDEPDVATLVPVSAAWLTAPWVEQLEAVLKRSRHPVLLGLVDGKDDPLSRQGAVAGYARIAAAVPDVVMWRTDLSGLGALAHGALAAVIGQRPGQRRYSQVGETPYASKLSDNTPHVLLPELLRYSRAHQMRTEWFATSPSLTCPCRYCQGLALDRFDKSAPSHAVAYLHNLTVLNGLVDQCLSAPDRQQWWFRTLQNAQGAHLELGNDINRPVPEPTSLRRWLRHHAI